MKHRILNTSDDFRRFKELHNLLFPSTDMSIEWMNWYISAGSLFPMKSSKQSFSTRVHGLFDDDELVGVWCVEPKDLITSLGKHQKVGRCFSVGIRSEHRRKNLFVELSTQAIEAEKQLGEYEYILGFPQRGRSVVGAHLKSGWEKVQNIEIYSQNPQLAQADEETLVSIAQIADFSSINRSSCTKQAQFHEIDAYKNYRWLKHPDNRYITLSERVEGDCSQGYVVMKQYSDVYHVVDIGGPSKNVLKLLNAARTLARRHRCKEINLWCAQNEQYRSAIELSGFNQGASAAEPIELLAAGINAKVPSEFDACHFSMGSEEIY